MQTGKLSFKKLLSFVILGTLFSLMTACTPSHFQSTFDTLGPVSENQAFIFIVIFWAGLFVFVAVEGALIYMIFRFRRRANQGDPEQTHGNNKLEIAWTIAPVIVLIVAAVPTIDGVFFAANSPVPPERGGLEIEAIGHQWWFEFRYPESGVVTANEMHIPVGEPVNMSLDSVDVIHSFWVPKLAGKVDMVPNNDNTMWLQANVAGEFFGQCAEFCGVSHANMRFKVIAHPRPEFEAWLAAQLEPGLVPVDPLAVEGEAVFTSRQVLCFRCHAIEGSRLARGTIGPNLTHMASRKNLLGMLRNTENELGGTINDSLLQQNLKNWLTDPDKIKPGNIMSRDAEVYNGTLPPLTERQVDALVAYLMTLK